MVYLDTNAFIYALEGEDALSAPMQELFAQLRKRPGKGVTSELTLAEALAPSRKGIRRPSHIKRLYLDLIMHSGFISLVPVTRSILLETTKLRATRATGKLRLLDAIHLATAIREGCPHFVTGDRGIPALPRGMRRVRPELSAVRTLIKGLR